MFHPGRIRRRKPVKKKRVQVTCLCPGWWFPHRRGSKARKYLQLTAGCNYDPGEPIKPRWGNYAALEPNS